MWPELVKLILTRVLSLLQLIEIDSGPDKKFRQGFIGTPASLIAQLVKNPPAMQETLVQFLGQEDPPEKG